MLKKPNHEFTLGEALDELLSSKRMKKGLTEALIKQQWGQNLIKFEGMQLPGGVTMNGRQLYDDATSEIKELDEKIRLEYELPPDFFVG